MSPPAQRASATIKATPVFPNAFGITSSEGRTTVQMLFARTYTCALWFSCQGAKEPQRNSSHSVSCSGTFASVDLSQPQETSEAEHRYRPRSFFVLPHRPRRVSRRAKGNASGNLARHPTGITSLPAPSRSAPPAPFSKFLHCPRTNPACINKPGGHGGRPRIPRRFPAASCNISERADHSRLCDCDNSYAPANSLLTRDSSC